MSCCFCCAVSERSCLLRIALSVSFSPLSFASSSLFGFQQLLSRGWRWRKLFLQVDGIIRQVSQAGRRQGWGAQLGKGAHVSSVPLRGGD